ncbi:MAG: AAA family ATPase [Candidatus Shapirobacteria bacterium]|jgi:shikimate kinase
MIDKIIIIKLSVRMKKKKILVIGASGSGKSFVAKKLRLSRVNAVDADLIEGLHGWYDGKGQKVAFPIGAGKDFLDNHQFLWDKNFLREYLKENNKVWLFGLSGNIFEMVDMFDKVYFLKVEPGILIERLDKKDRINPMGKTEYQKKAVVEYAKKIERTAKSLKIEFIDGTLAPEEIKKIIEEG